MALRLQLRDRVNTGLAVAVGSAMIQCPIPLPTVLPGCTADAGLAALEESLKGPLSALRFLNQG